MINLNKLSIIFCLICMLFCAQPIKSVWAQESDQKLSNKRYIDPKGYFKIVPPSGWQIKEYPDDSRGKVAFIGPDLDLRVLVAAVDFNTINELISFCQNVEKRIGIDTNIKEIIFNGMPAVNRSYRVKDQKFYSIDILVEKCNHNLQFGGSLKNFDKYLAIALKSIDTYEPVIKEITDEEIKAHFISRKVRLAQLMIERMNYNLALEYINEGLEIFPTNQDLLKLKQKIKDMESKGRLIEKEKKEVETKSNEKEEKLSTENSGSRKKKDSNEGSLWTFIILAAIFYGIYRTWFGGKGKK